MGRGPAITAIALAAVLLGASGGALVGCQDGLPHQVRRKEGAS